MAYIMRAHKTKGTQIGHYKVKVYDAGPRSGHDRYTICADGGEDGDRPIFAASVDPFWGVGQYVGELYVKYFPPFGKLIAWHSLPDAVRRFAEYRLRDQED